MERNSGFADAKFRAENSFSPDLEAVRLEGVCEGLVEVGVGDAGVDLFGSF